MNASEALKITTETLRLDATLQGEPLNLNHVTFWLSEISYGNKWTGNTVWMHTPENDIVRTAAAIAEASRTAAELLAIAAAIR